jgi:hypothetical protein
MAYGVHHTLELWLDNNRKIRTGGAVFSPNFHSPQRAAFFTQHEIFTYGAETYHVLVDGGMMPRSVCEKFVLLACAQSFRVFDLRTLGTNQEKRK